MSYSPQNIRNICLLGHGGNGKTTLVESFLSLTGGSDRMGRTSEGNTVCDYDPEEIKRQISISAAVAPVEYNGCKINVLDCPGFFDFAGDVMCALRAVEAGIIFCTAKDGIAVGAERSWKYLKNANMPCMFYVSKTNEDHGDFAAVLSALRGELLQLASLLELELDFSEEDVTFADRTALQELLDRCHRSGAQCGLPDQWQQDREGRRSRRRRRHGRVAARDAL